jgi:ParB-like chromosome segregation protein Spo0J
MDLERHQLELRYESLRTRNATRERRLLASLAEVGQQMPIVVVRETDRFVVVDGYKRLRALGRLGCDLVHAAEWALGEADALMLERALRGGDADSAVEQGWFLREMHQHFGLALGDLARRMGRTVSWVSRRIALVTDLPASVQEHVRAGAIGAHAAMKVLVPLARANADDCMRLADAVAPERPTSRQMAELYAAYVGGSAQTRERVVRTPAVILRAAEEARRAVVADRSPVERVLDDLRIVAAVARRVCTRLSRGALDGASANERERVHVACVEALGAADDLRRRHQREVSDAG